MDPENLFVICVAREGFTEDMLAELEELPVPEVLFSCRPLAGKSVFVLKDCTEIRPSGRTETGLIMEEKGWSGRRPYDAFDFAKWLNTGSF